MSPQTHSLSDPSHRFLKIERQSSNKEGNTNKHMRARNFLNSTNSNPKQTRFNGPDQFLNPPAFQPSPVDFAPGFGFSLNFSILNIWLQN